VTTGDAGIIGEIGIARTPIGDSGSVFVHGEHWNAYSDEPVAADSKVRVVAVEGMTLKVQPLSTKEGS
jgi:membrane-bound serine protease (ClpP class)